MIKLNLKIVLTKNTIIAEPQRLMATSRKKGQEANREKKIYEKKAKKQTKQQACALRKISGSNQAFQLGCPGLKVSRL